MDAYNAVICRLQGVRKHSGADRLKIAVTSNFQVIIGLEHIEGELGIYFPEGTQISRKFAEANDLIRRKDETGKQINSGMFEENRKVKTIKLRGERSEGFWCPLSYLDFVGQHKLVEGDRFDSVNTIPICHKYYTPQTLKQRNKGHSNVLPENVFMRKHFDTDQLRNNYEKIAVNSYCILTYKKHGSSFRASKALSPRKLAIKDKIARWFGVKVQEEEWGYIHGSRNITLFQGKGEDFHGDKFRREVANHIEGRLRCGEAVYGEVVGWQGPDSPIMGSHSNSKVKDKEFSKQYGETTIFKYGCPNGTWDLYIYRITQTTPCSHTRELPWEEVKLRCVEIGLKHVIECESFIFDGDIEGLKTKVAKYLDKP